MGMYLNPGNEGFANIIKGEYVDKTGLIRLINERIDKPDDKLICISRPRRFGKSYAAQMLSAYYDHTCNSAELFDGKEISSAKSYKQHMNGYQIIYLDMSNLLGKVKPEGLISFIEENVENEILAANPEVKKGATFDTTLYNAVKAEGKKFIAIIDEWDAPIRETPQISEEYLLFLRMLFKSSSTTANIFAAAYMTGILPIKKYGRESAVSDFNEYTIINPGDFAPYTGFTEDDVKKLCDKFDISYKRMKHWYDGYSVGNIESVYNPFAVMKAIKEKRFDSFWRHTTAADNLLRYINMSVNNDSDGLQIDIARLIDGETIEIDTGSFQNDVNSFSSKNDVLTLLVHLGYLSYRKVFVTDDDGEILRETELVNIPNEEIRREFKSLLPRAEHKILRGLLEKSKKLYEDTLAGNEGAVVAAIKEIRHMNYAPTFYNDEQALRYVIKFAYIYCVDDYLKIEELPSGHGIADVVYLPQKRNDPAIVVELKWNKTDEAAIAQIKNKDYPAILKSYSGIIILVGINYDEKTDEHSCRIETVLA